MISGSKSQTIPTLPKTLQLFGNNCSTFGPVYRRVDALVFTRLNALEAASLNDFCHTSFFTFPLLVVNSGYCIYVLVLKSCGS